MTFDGFTSSLAQANPPTGCSIPLEALWWAGKGEWDRAHSIVQSQEGQRDSDWVHAHLHRQEGDMTNAAAWYRDAGRTMPDGPLDEEWKVIARELLGRS